MQRFRIITLAACLFAGAAATMAQDFGPEEHIYSINWKWGLINMNAAQAHVKTSCSNGNFFGTLTGQSIPWEGHIYAVSDTLQATLQSGAECIDYVNGWYRKPKAKGPQLPEDNPESYLTIQGQGELNGSDATMEAIAVTANMLSMYYYARCIDFDCMKAGQELSIPISGNGNKPTMLRITYNSPCECGYSITFSYDFDNVPDSYEVECEIDSASRLPVMFSSNIRIGHVAMTLVE